MKPVHRLLPTLVLTAVLVAVSSGALGASELAVGLPPAIEARDGWFHLGEYAELEGREDIVSAASMAVIEHDGSFSVEDVVDALEEAGLSGRTVKIRMPSVVSVAPEPEISARLREMTAWKWRIDADGGKSSRSGMTEGFKSFSLPPRVMPGARVLAVKLEDESGRRFNKQVKLRWYQPVVYSVKPVEKDSPLDPSTLRERIGTASLNRESVWGVSRLRGAAARRSLNAGSPITASDITRANFVRAGSAVTLTARVNGLGVEVNGIAMQRGDIGDVIRVKNLSSKRIVTGRVIDIGRVEIIPARFQPGSDDEL
ncbi:MAG: flagellar basal body P-ring formation chaperone FlgA [Synergistaceae bacterium]|jgi:flagella basal body P-ring formation protein FlgA|nr:flagellar basal body P-ring formation chaperone FlgA [Synergistaceae bacterium]